MSVFGSAGKRFYHPHPRLQRAMGRVLACLIIMGAAWTYPANGADGDADPAFNPNGSINIASMALQPDGKIVIGGGFTNVGGLTRNYIARLNADGTVDTAFNPNASLAVFAIAVQSDGKILIGGTFTT
jgi:hypothetical protein